MLLGENAVIYWSSDNGVTFNVIGNVVDVDDGLSVGEVDVGTRLDGWEAFAASRYKIQPSFKMLRDPLQTHDASWVTLRNNFYNATTGATLQFLILDGAKSPGSGTGIQFTGYVSEFATAQPLKGAQMTAVKINRTYGTVPSTYP